MDVGHLNQIGQGVLTWVSVFAAIWAVLAGTKVGGKLASSKTAQAARDVLGTLAEVANIVVRATEQSAKTDRAAGRALLPNDSLKAMATDRAIEMLRTRGVKYDLTDLDAAIEAAVQKMNSERAAAAPAGP